MYLDKCRTSKIHLPLKSFIVFTCRFLKQHLRTQALFYLKKIKKSYSRKQKESLGTPLILKDIEIYFELYSHSRLSQKTESSVKSIWKATVRKPHYNRITTNNEQFQNLDEELTSPLKPYVEILAKSSNFWSLLVVNLSHTMSRSSFYMKATNNSHFPSFFMIRNIYKLK